MLSINKIYIDSRHKTQSSASDSNFEIQLKEPINLPDNSICVVSDVLLKNTITTIEKFNENMYVRINEVDTILTLNNRNYSILEAAVEKGAKLNRVADVFRAVEDVYNTKVIVDVGRPHTLRIFTDQELKLNNVNWTGKRSD